MLSNLRAEWVAPEDCPWFSGRFRAAGHQMLTLLHAKEELQEKKKEVKGSSKRFL